MTTTHLTEIEKIDTLIAYLHELKQQKQGLGGFQISLDYPVTPQSRWGYGKPSHPELTRIIAQADDTFKNYLSLFSDFEDRLLAIPMTADDEDPVACWDNAWLPVMDALSLYSMMAHHKPQRYFEVGSGNSTRFTKLAIEDFELSTHIISVDPQPRAYVDSLCDEVHRCPLEELDLKLFDQLEAGDFVFIDNSHRVFCNSDVTLFFLEILPRLKPGIIVQVHDIFLPNDYPPAWHNRYYSEQYLLAAYLLGGNTLKVLLPNNYIIRHNELSLLIEPIIDKIANLCDISPEGLKQSSWIKEFNQFCGSFWFEITG